MPIVLAVFFVMATLTYFITEYKVGQQEKYINTKKEELFSGINKYINRVKLQYSENYSQIHIQNYMHFKCNMNALPNIGNKLDCAGAFNDPNKRFRYYSLVLLSNGNMCYYDMSTKNVYNSTCKPLKNWIYSTDNPDGTITYEDYKILKGFMPPSLQTGQYIPGLLIKGVSYLYGQNMEEIPYLRMGVEIYKREGGKFKPFEYYNVPTEKVVNEKIKYIYENLDKMSSYVREYAKYLFSQSNLNPYAFQFSASLLQYNGDFDQDNYYHVIVDYGLMKYGLDTSLLLALDNHYIYIFDKDDNTIHAELPGTLCNDYYPDTCTRLTTEYEKYGALNGNDLTDTPLTYTVSNIDTPSPDTENVYMLEYDYTTGKLKKVSGNYTETFGNPAYSDKRLYDFVNFAVPNNESKGYLYAWDYITSSTKDRQAIIFNDSNIPYNGLYKDIYSFIDKYTDFKSADNYAAFKVEYTSSPSNGVTVARIVPKTLKEFYEDMFNIDITNVNFENPLFPNQLTIYKGNTADSQKEVLKFNNKTFLVDNSSNLNYSVNTVDPYQLQILSSYSITFGVPIVYDISETAISNQIGNPLKGILYKTYTITTLN